MKNVKSFCFNARKISFESEHCELVKNPCERHQKYFNDDKHTASLTKPVWHANKIVGADCTTCCRISVKKGSCAIWMVIRENWENVSCTCFAVSLFLLVIFRVELRQFQTNTMSDGFNRCFSFSIFCQKLLGANVNEEDVKQHRDTNQATK